VRQCIEYIRAGDLYQANVTLRLEAAFEGSALDLWADAAAALQPRYAAFVEERPGVAACSLSPELFLRRRGREVVSAPIKGTAPRGVPGAREALEASEKDRAENVMILDLMRNDLGRVASFGSVRVVDVARAEPHAGVWHLVSEVAASLREDADDAALLRATFPPGSVTGAPKVKALEVISTLESTGRETYTGALGFASPVAGLELNVAIRTFEVAGARIWLGAGGGVVADSDPASEYEEALVKARPLVAAVGSSIAADATPVVVAAPVPPPTRRPRPDPARGVFTTMLTTQSGPVDLDRHLARLATSAHTLYGLDVADDLRRATAGTDTCVARLRIDVAADGSVTSAVTPVAASAPRPALEPLVVPGGLGEHKWADRSILEGCDGEPLIVDLDGSVLESGWGNVWLVEGGRLVTPPADGRILPGVTRAVLLELWPGAVVEPVSLDRLRAADEVFVTSSVRGVAAARGSGLVTRRVAARLDRHRDAAAAPTVA
jgi:para-aminobenzoate synthetase/4-amino-4-deoxychorismate lyase